MLYLLENLTNAEKETVLNAPALVTILIADADQEIQAEEIRRAIQLVHVKSYAESVDIRELYQNIDQDFERRLSNLIDRLPRSHAERERALIEELSKLNAVYKRMEHKVAVKFHESLIGFAANIARAAGGVFGLESISEKEARFLGLPMIEKP